MSTFYQIRLNHLIFYTDSGDDWCPPANFTSDILPTVYGNLDDEEKVQLENGARVGRGKVFTFLRKICT